MKADLHRMVDCTKVLPCLLAQPNPVLWCEAHLVPHDTKVPGTPSFNCGLGDHLLS